MGYRDYKSASGSTLWNTSNPLVMLIILNAIVFILLNFLKSIYTFSSIPEEAFYKNIYHLFAMPADPMVLASRPWTILTMQFSEVKLFVAISNFFWIWVFGYLIQDLFGGDKLIPMYLYCGTVSAISFFIASNLFYGDQVAGIYFTGISSAVLGLAVAAATLSPQYRFFPMIGGGIPLWIISLVYLLVDFSAMAKNPIMLIPHAAAGLMGFLFVKLVQQGNDPGAWMNNLSSKIASWFTPQKKVLNPTKHAAFYEQGKKRPFTKTSNITQQRIDTILDKINQQGYEKLTDEEKKILKQASKEDL